MLKTYWNRVHVSTEKIKAVIIERRHVIFSKNLSSSIPTRKTVTAAPKGSQNNTIKNEMPTKADGFLSFLKPGN